MKYVLKATVKSKAIILMILRFIANSIYIVINAKILLWLSLALTEENHMHYANLVMVGSLVNMVLSSLISLLGLQKMMIFTELQNMLVDKVLRSGVDLFSKFSPGAIGHIGNTLNAISGAFALFLDTIKAVVLIVVYVWSIYSIDSSHIVHILVIMTSIAICMAIVNYMWNKIDKKIDTLKTERNVELDEILNGFMEVRSFPGTVESHRTAILSQNGTLLKLFFRRNILNLTISATTELASSALTIIILLYCIANPNLLSSAISMTLVMYTWRLLEPVCDLVFYMSDLSDMCSGIPKFKEIMQFPETIENGDINLDEFNSSIEINNVSFSYDSSSNVLSNICMSIPKGSHIGICGPSGGGKSTFLKLLPRFYDVTSGQILIDGINIKDLKIESMRKLIGIVHQSTYIFDGTLFDNIAYAKRPNKPTEFEVVEACKKAYIYDFIKSLPEGFETKVGPRGLKLSGGQKQRISLARLFLLNPEIIILDEATSALDNESETIIQEAINSFKGKTIITVAHRLSTIKDCDTIYVISDHKIVECGTHEELLSLKGVYYNMQK